MSIDLDSERCARWRWVQGPKPKNLGTVIPQSRMNCPKFVIEPLGPVPYLIHICRVIEATLVPPIILALAQLRGALGDAGRRRSYAKTSLNEEST